MCVLTSSQTCLSQTFQQISIPIPQMFYHIKGKGTAVPVQSMKEYRRSRDTAPANFRHVPIAARSVS
jgi:hypothetical protein